MAFAGVHHQHAGLARCIQDGCDRLHRTRKLRNIVAERFTEAAGLHEIALHVDDQKRGGGPVERDGHRLRGDRADGWTP